MTAFIWAFIVAHWRDILDVVVTIIVALAGSGLLKHHREENVRQAIKGAFVVVAQIAERTPMTWDDAIVAILRRAEAELGKLSVKEKSKGKLIVEALQADSTRPTVPLAKDKLNARP